MAEPQSRPDAQLGPGRRLDSGWSLTLTPAGAHQSVDDLPDSDLIDVPVPGTVAQALEAAGQFDRLDPTSFDDIDAWYRCHLTGTGTARLHLDGLASLCDVYLNNTLVLHSENMFVGHSVDLELSGKDELTLKFAGLGERLEQRGARARWRTMMMTPPTLKNLRTTTLGRMPSWCPEVHAMGPWRQITLSESTPQAPALDPRDVQLAASFDDGVARLNVTATTSGDLSEASVSCGSTTARFDRTADGWSAQLAPGDVEPWWPHTHGTPRLYDVSLDMPGQPRASLGRVGFRRLDVDTDDGAGFALRVNGERVFCRGAVWTNADIVRLPGERDDYEPWLRLAAAAGMNMIRMSGTTVYETRSFFELCDELGLMVWQDFMFANFDYPSDDSFAEQVRAEAEFQLSVSSGSPSLAVLCGGSEMLQQAAMMGRPIEAWTNRSCDETLPEVAARRRPDVPYVRNSPSGGAVPFSPRNAVTHYFGVGAYLRPLSDARLARVRFASECLAFAHVPQQVTLDEHLPVPAVHHPDWKAAVPRDRGATWDFEDVRDFYLRELYGTEPNDLRRQDLPSYLALSRAVTAEVVEATFSEWRRPGSDCAGALVWTLQDLVPGAGWGVIDSTGLPKPVWHAMRRALRPVQVLLIDEGTNGMDVHVLNERATPIDVVVDVSCVRGPRTVVAGSTQLTVEPRGSQSIAVTEIFGHFFDTSRAFCFGPAEHDVVIARLSTPSGDLLGEAFAFPLGRSAAMHEAHVSGRIVADGEGYAVDVIADSFAQSVHLDVPGFLPGDDWFHLAAGEPRRVSLMAREDAPQQPRGTVGAVNGRPVQLSM